MSLLYVTSTTTILGGLAYNICTGESLGPAIFHTWMFDLGVQ